MTTTINPSLPDRAAVSPPRDSVARRGSVFLYRHAKVRLGLLLSAPLFWLGLVYIAALIALLITALWTVDSFTGDIIIEWSFDNIMTVLTGAVYQAVTLRTLGAALLVTVIDVVVALPIAFFMAKVASTRAQRWLLIAILTPLWASYLVKAYAWRSVLSEGGVLDSALAPFGGSTPGYGFEGTVITLAYLWLPFVILPIYTALDRVPNSLLEASSDLGATTGTTFRHIVFPMITPGIIAGSIFSFSLTLGDYISVKIVGGATQMLGTLVYANVGTANNLPLAAAIALIPITIIFVYLAAVRRTGALDNL
ncbi:putative spermidine/putrescine transport system permease protein [Microbacteriaceae bacterium MWH-Ta3]|nr:putative spermidine/putrescine transport system permease protein [Microbacteriaceae bacterium MWH-Ta3]